MKDIIKVLEKIPSSNELILELVSCVSNFDADLISNFFDNIDKCVIENRRKMFARFHQTYKMWDSPEGHAISIKSKEVVELRVEFDDNLGLFKLGKLANFEPFMKLKFEQMIQNLSDIRERTSIRTERDKIVWDDPLVHFKMIEAEKMKDIEDERCDLIYLYNIANESCYDEGMNMIIDKLATVDPKLATELVAKKKTK